MASEAAERSPAASRSWQALQSVSSWLGLGGAAEGAVPKGQASGEEDEDEELALLPLPGGPGCMDAEGRARWTQLRVAAHVETGVLFLFPFSASIVIAASLDETCSFNLRLLVGIHTIDWVVIVAAKAYAFAHSSEYFVYESDEWTRHRWTAELVNFFFIIVETVVAIAAMIIVAGDWANSADDGVSGSVGEPNPVSCVETAPNLFKMEVAYFLSTVFLVVGLHCWRFRHLVRWHC